MLKTVIVDRVEGYWSHPKAGTTSNKFGDMLEALTQAHTAHGEAHKYLRVRTPGPPPARHLVILWGSSMDGQAGERRQEGSRHVPGVARLRKPRS